MHDLAAELQGYQNELAQLEQANKTERADAVREEITRVGAVVREKAEALDRAAESHDAAGQDVRAAEARVEARQLRELLGEEEPKRRRGRPRKETTAETRPKETAAETPGNGE